MSSFCVGCCWKMCGACVMFLRLISPNSAVYLALKVLIYDGFLLIFCTQQALCMTQLNVFFYIINHISDARVHPTKEELQAETDTQTKFPFTVLDNVFFFFCFFFLDDLLNVHSSALLWLYNIGLCNMQLQPSPGDTHGKSKPVNKYSDILNRDGIKE